jgi:hypothetical protein
MLRGLLAALLACSVLPQADFLRDALNLGRTHDAALYDAFQAGYSLTPSGIVARVEVITEFRRAVLIVREHADQGEYSFNANDLATAVAPYRGLLGVLAEVRLHPLHTFTQPPPYDFYVRTGPASKPLAAAGLKRTPVYPAGMNPPGTAFIAVRLEGTFDRAEIASAAEPALVIVNESGIILWQARLDVARYR